ncbi:hypothetical protein GPAL_3812 [Glaciecola pallidula DSM 14239 = ACAM 615]|uniref:Uncharacterized protein n=1 Tax=Brumicola pallidula DSM 14239 = ACAM 615 TaxID=1121922 RepID=K6ZJY1_9ALTE|nr:hypothetical protein GPAL_3812 [Glaciecola pallidula DSM 14239 = ACAM 615]
MKNKIQFFSLFCMLSVLSSASSKTELFEGENLITPFSNELSDWDVYKKQGIRSR